MQLIILIFFNFYCHALWGWLFAGSCFGKQHITPAILVGGFVGLNHVTLDVITMIIMPMLPGLAVDDTIHFITHGKLEFQRSGSYRVAVRETFVTAGKALFLTSFIPVASFSACLISDARVFF